MRIYDLSGRLVRKGVAIGSGLDWQTDKPVCRLPDERNLFVSVDLQGPLSFCKPARTMAFQQDTSRLMSRKLSTA